MSYHWLVWAAVFLAVVFFIRYLNIFVRIVYLKKPDNHSLNISISLFNRLKIYTFQTSLSDFFEDKLPRLWPEPGKGEDKDSVPAPEEQVTPQKKEGFGLSRQVWDKLVASLYFEKIRLVLTYGFEDAALTGVSNGFLTALGGVFPAIWGSYFKMKEAPDISVNPVYGNDRLEIEFNCIFSIRLGNVIAIAASFFRGYCNIFKRDSKFIQGGEGQWRNILSRT